MKNVLLTLMMVFAVSVGFVSCEADPINDEQTQATDKDKVCPPGNPDCNNGQG